MLLIVVLESCTGLFILFELLTCLPLETKYKSKHKSLYASSKTVHSPTVSWQCWVVVFHTNCVEWKKLHLTVISCLLLESFVSRFLVSPSGRVTASAGIVTSLCRIRVLYYHISTGKSHIINRIYPHLLCKSTNIQSLCLCLITFLNTTFFPWLTLPGLIYRNVLKLFLLRLYLSC